MRQWTVSGRLWEFSAQSVEVYGRFDDVEAHIVGGVGDCDGPARGGAEDSRVQHQGSRRAAAGRRRSWGCGDRLRRCLRVVLLLRLVVGSPGSRELAAALAGAVARGNLRRGSSRDVQVLLDGVANVSGLRGRAPRVELRRIAHEPPPSCAEAKPKEAPAREDARPAADERHAAEAIALEAGEGVAQHRAREAASARDAVEARAFERRRPRRPERRKAGEEPALGEALHQAQQHHQPRRKQRSRWQQEVDDASDHQREQNRAASPVTSGKVAGRHLRHHVAEEEGGEHLTLHGA